MKEAARAWSERAVGIPSRRGSGEGFGRSGAGSRRSDAYCRGRSRRGLVADLPDCSDNRPHRYCPGQPGRVLPRRGYLMIWRPGGILTTTYPMTTHHQTRRAGLQPGISRNGGFSRDVGCAIPATEDRGGKRSPGCLRAQALPYGFLFLSDMGRNSRLRRAGNNL
jgi:hypothetical protein